MVLCQIAKLQRFGFNKRGIASQNSAVSDTPGLLEDAPIIVANQIFSSAIAMPSEPLKLFISYSHKDEPLREELGKHLRILERQKLITIWHDRKILAGDEWNHQINTYLETANIILLLISSDFIDSSYCWDIEIERAMQLHESEQACVIPVILRSVDWTSAPFGKLQAVPRNAQPVTLQPDRDAAFEFVTKQIRQVAIELSAKREKQREQAKKEEAIARYRQQFEEFAARNGCYSRRNLFNGFAGWRRRFK